MILTSPIKDVLCSPINTVFDVNCSDEEGLPPPVITQEPQDQSVIVGATCSFTVAATVDVGTVDFQWQADTGSGFVDIPTETNATLTLPPVALINNGNLFRARVTANGRSAVSRAALLSVTL